MSPQSPSGPVTGGGGDRVVCEGVGGKDPVPVWPYLVYAGAWVLFAALTVWRLLSLPAAEPVHGSAAHTSIVASGVVLSAVGPLVTALAWGLGRRSGRPSFDIACSALLKGAITMLAGVCLWWAALIVVDRFRLGRVL